MVTGLHLEMAAHLVLALFIGGMVGLERSYHGRPAGFRTHALVCLASSLLMMVTFYQTSWLPNTPLDTVRADPARMAQGIMTGIGFLGAGVIFKEGLTVRGLTTAASIWITASLGILVGIGFYFPALLAALLSMVTLSLFRWIEFKMPSQIFFHHEIRFERAKRLSEKEIVALLEKEGFNVTNITHRVFDEWYEYHMTLRTKLRARGSHLADFWESYPNVVEYTISPTGD